MVFWFWWAPISCVHVQRLEHVPRWDLRIRLGRPSKSRLLLPLFGGLPCGLLKLFLLQVKASGEGLRGLPFSRRLCITSVIPSRGEFVCGGLGCLLARWACRGREDRGLFLSLRPCEISLCMNRTSGWECGAAPGGHHCSCGSVSLSRPALTLCSDNPARLDKRYAPLCLHLLDPFLK